jgi:hypothetical protein
MSVKREPIMSVKREPIKRVENHSQPGEHIDK